MMILLPSGKMLSLGAVVAMEPLARYSVQNCVRGAQPDEPSNLRMVTVGGEFVIEGAEAAMVWRALSWQAEILESWIRRAEASREDDAAYRRAVQASDLEWRQMRMRTMTKAKGTKKSVFARVADWWGSR